MRSRRSRHRAACILLPLLAASLLGTSGCQLNRSFFQMDSNSKLPFFGVDLTPKWSKRTSSVDGVSRLQNESVQIDTSGTTVEPHVAAPQRLRLTAADSADEAPSDAAPAEQFR